jgi:hypothetical protein
LGFIIFMQVFKMGQIFYALNWITRNRYDYDQSDCNRKKWITRNFVHISNKEILYDLLYYYIG